MKIKDLLSVRRLQRCRRIFRRPLHVHTESAAAGSHPLAVELVSGGTLRIDDMRPSRPMFDWLLSESPDPFPIVAEEGNIVFRHQGRRVSLRPSGFEFDVFRQIFVNDMYGLNGLHGPLDTVVDLGTNVGLFTLRVAPLARRVIGVEPVEANLALARRNLADGGIADKARVLKLAVTAQSGESVRIHISPSNSGANSLWRENVDPWGGGAFEDVTTISLPDLFTQEHVERCSLLKCDIEGAEFEIFRTLPADVLARIERIVMEVHLTSGVGDAKTLDELITRLQDAGFTVTHESLLDRRGQPRPTLMLTAVGAGCKW